MALRKVILDFCWFFFNVVDAVSTSHFVWLTILNMYVLSHRGEPACTNSIFS